MDIGTILVMVLIGIMIVIIIILAGGVTVEIFWMSTTNKNQLHSMEK